MTKLQYLYGEHASAETWKHLPYTEAFELKNKLAQEVVSEILNQHYSIRDEARLSAVLKAIAFNEERMRE